jgi:hypothetical protein
MVRVMNGILPASYNHLSNQVPYQAFISSLVRPRSDTVSARNGTACLKLAQAHHTPDART